MLGHSMTELIDIEFSDMSQVNFLPLKDAFS